MSLTARASIDLAALRHNLDTVRRSSPGTRVMACVKADAYGHGLVRVGRALDGRVDALAVARVNEALELRSAGVACPIVLLEGVFSASELASASAQSLTLVLHAPEQLELLAGHPGAPLPVWLKLDSGMGRLGFPFEEAKALHARLAGMAAVAGPPGLMTHLGCADDLEADTTSWQLGRFDSATAGLLGPRSIANSAGLIAWPESRADWVRPGMALYGASPVLGRSAPDLGLKPVMRLLSSLISVKTIPEGGRVGYGATWQAPEAMRLGLVGIGYGDGYPWRAAPCGAVVLGDRRIPIVGRVSMDMLAVDLRDAPGAAVGDEVVLWGPELPVEEVAAWAGTIPYELLCGVTRRVEMSELPAS